MEHYEEYFTESPGDTTHAVSSLELLHYREICQDWQVVNPEAYRTNKRSHVYSLLRHLVAVSKEEEGVGIYL